MNEINYYKEFIDQYHEIKKEYKNKLPKLLLHVCCGACSCYPLVFLIDLFDVTILFSNSNIFPKDEFNKRLNALRKYVAYINKEFNKNIEIIVDEYNYNEFKVALEPFKDEKEGGARCKICIAKRMNRLFDYAFNHDFKFVTTVMSVSRNKDVYYLNEIGKKLETQYINKITYIYSDFKKNNGQDKGVELSKKVSIYRQDYCGCEFSLINK